MPTMAQEFMKLKMLKHLHQYLLDCFVQSINPRIDSFLIGEQ